MALTQEAIRFAENASGVAYSKWIDKFGDPGTGTTDQRAEAAAVASLGLAPGKMAKKLGGRADLAARVTLLMDPGVNVFVERTGALADLTPAKIGDPVGTWADTTGTYIFRAPADVNRMTLATLHGQTVLLRTADPQFYVSADAASTWKWLHDGTKYSFAAGWQIPSAGSDKALTLAATYNSSSAEIGFHASYSDRFTANSGWNEVLMVEVTNGTASQQPVRLNGGHNERFSVQPGWPQGNWAQMAMTVDPSAAAGGDRCTIYHRGLSSAENINTFTPSASNPSATLHIGDYSVRYTIEQTNCYFGPIAFYQGTWTADELRSVQTYLDFAQHGIAEVVTPQKNISGQYTAYEAFPVMIRLASGVLLITYRSGATHAGDKGTITVARSFNNGRDWELTHDAITDATYDLRSAEPIQLANGDIITLSSRQIFATITSVDVLASKSTDGGKTFSTLTTFGPDTGFDYLFPYGGAHLLSNGTILAPMYAKETATADLYSEIWQSTDSGANWTKRSQIGTVVGGLTETSILNVSGSDWVAVIRQQGNVLYYATSADDCATWTTPVSAAVEGVAPSLFRVKDRIYCLGSDRAAPEAIRLLSWHGNHLHGEGKSWLLFSASTSSGYPSIVVENQVAFITWYDELAVSPGIQVGAYKLPKV